jgi:hypothetical protein
MEQKVKYKKIIKDEMPNLSEEQVDAIVNNLITLAKISVEILTKSSNNHTIVEKQPYLCYNKAKKVK